MTNNKENILSFNNSEFGKIRTVVIDEEPWFVGKDVATALGYKDPSSAVSKNVEFEDKTTLLIQQDGSNYKSRTTFINKSGMYALIFRSKLESAKRFKHWITTDVIPSFRHNTTSETSNNLISVNNTEFGDMRIILIHNEPYFCLTDVCKALELTQVSRVKSRLNADGVTTSKVIDRLGREQQATFINEANLYKTIFQSRKPSAEKFTDWVTSEVLPSIRKTGKYEQSQPESRELVMAKGLIAANEMIQEQKQTIADQQILIEQQQDRIEDLEETEKDWKLLMDAEGSFSINQLSQFINIGEYKLFKYLRDFKLLFKNENNDNVPYRKYLQTGKFIVVPAVAPNGVTHSQTRVLPEGIPVITNLLRKNAVLA